MRLNISALRDEERFHCYGDIVGRKSMYLLFPYSMNATLSSIMIMSIRHIIDLIHKKKNMNQTIVYLKVKKYQVYSYMTFLYTDNVQFDEVKPYGKIPKYAIAQGPNVKKIKK